MAISFKKIFKKDQPTQQAEKITQDPNVKAQATEGETGPVKAENKGKHGEPGVCCGSCS